MAEAKTEGLVAINHRNGFPAEDARLRALAEQINRQQQETLAALEKTPEQEVDAHDMAVWFGYNGY